MSNLRNVSVLFAKVWWVHLPVVWIFSWQRIE